MDHLIFNLLEVDGYPVVLEQFVEKVILFSYICLLTLVENQLTINVRFYFWTLNSTPLIYMSTVMPVPHCLDYCSFVGSLE